MTPEQQPEIVDAGRVRLIATANAASPLVERFYRGFDASFALPNEKETLEGIRACLSLNEGATAQTIAVRFGRVREFVAVVETIRDVADGIPAGCEIGGANCIIFATEPADNGTRGRALLVHLNYVFVLAHARGHGLLGDIVNAVAGLALTSAAAGSRRRFGLWPLRRERWPAPLVFIEQNDPFRLSADEYAADTAHAGIDQFARIGVWSGLGAKVVDFPYVQPPLSDAQDPDENLALAVLGASGDMLDARLLAAHLERFFSVSVLKGSDARSVPSAAAQLADLDECSRDGALIALLPLPRAALAAAATARQGGRSAPYRDLRAYLRALAAGG